MTWARWPRWRRQPAPELEPEAAPAATLDDADMRRLAVGLLIGAVDDNEDGIRAVLAGLPATDLVELAVELAGLGTAVWKTRGASRNTLRESLHIYALQLAVEPE